MSPPNGFRTAGVSPAFAVNWPGHPLQNSAKTWFTHLGRRISTQYLTVVQTT